MPASTNKKVLIRRFDREPLAGFVNPANWLQPHGIELLSQAGNMLVVPYPEVKAVYFVRDFSESPAEARVFQTRPKLQGVWLRMRFRDGDVMDGLLANNLVLLDPYGFSIVPPNPVANSQRVFVPRAALTDAQVLGVVGVKPPKQKAKPKEQIGLFEE